MKITLSNGYPFPYPHDESMNLLEDIAAGAGDFSFTIEGVAHFEFKHTVTVEFDSRESFDAAKVLTGWDVWDSNSFVLEANYSFEDGYGGFPALILAQKYESAGVKTEKICFCGVQVLP